MDCIPVFIQKATRGSPLDIQKQRKQANGSGLILNPFFLSLLFHGTADFGIEAIILIICLAAIPSLAGQNKIQWRLMLSQESSVLEDLSV